MPHEVMIDGIKYAPQAAIQQVDDEVIRKALHELLSLHYFDNWHKAQGVTGLVIEILSPDLSKVMQADIGAAFERTSPTN